MTEAGYPDIWGDSWVGMDCGDPAAAVDRLTPAQTATLGEVTLNEFVAGAGDNAREVCRIRFKLVAKITRVALLLPGHKS
jgi:hypothetical protein